MLAIDAAAGAWSTVVYRSWRSSAGRRTPRCTSGIRPRGRRGDQRRRRLVALDRSRRRRWKQGPRSRRLHWQRRAAEERRLLMDQLRQRALGRLLRIEELLVQLRRLLLKALQRGQRRLRGAERLLNPGSAGAGLPLLGGRHRLFRCGRYGARRLRRPCGVPGSSRRKSGSSGRASPSSAAAGSGSRPPSRPDSPHARTTPASPMRSPNPARRACGRRSHRRLRQHTPQKPNRSAKLPRQAGSKSIPGRLRGKFLPRFAPRLESHS